MGNTKAVRMTTINLVVENDVRNALDDAERVQFLDDKAAERSKALGEVAAEAGYTSFSELARALADRRERVMGKQQTA